MRTISLEKHNLTLEAGTYDSNGANPTFIDGEFVGGPTVTGSVHIVSGTHNRRDIVWFALYRIPAGE